MNLTDDGRDNIDDASRTDGRTIPSYLDTTAQEKIYRVSWEINGRRQEKYFMYKQWADRHVQVLCDAANVLQTQVQPFIKELEVSNE